MGLGRGLVEGLVGVNVEEDREEVLRELGNDGAELGIVSFDLSIGVSRLTASTLVRRSRSSIQALQMNGFRWTLLIRYSLASSLLLLLARTTP